MNTPLACVAVSLCTHTHIHTHIHTYIYTHTHTLSLSLSLTHTHTLTHTCASPASFLDAILSPMDSIANCLGPIKLIPWVSSSSQNCILCAGVGRHILSIRTKYSPSHTVHYTHNTHLHVLAQKAVARVHGLCTCGLACFQDLGDVQIALCAVRVCVCVCGGDVCSRIKGCAKILSKHTTHAHTHTHTHLGAGPTL
jgi:hypothetical protein